tara:strand:+ start:664 stop:1458 length:795 start_codon:yes stop_codon:yes gene_type:complete
MVRAFQLVTICLLFTFVVSFDVSAKSSYKPINENQSQIIFNYDRKIFKNIEFSLKDWDEGYRYRVYWAGNRNSKKVGKEIWISVWYNELARGRHYPDRYNLRERLPSWNAFKNRTNLILNSGVIETEFAEFDYLIFRSDQVPCSIFSATFGDEHSNNSAPVAGTVRINGALCLEKQDDLKASHLENLIGAIGIKDMGDPKGKAFTLESESLKAKTDNSEKSSTANREDNSNQLKELEKAKDMFERDLITKGEYENLKKKILGLN